MAAMYWIEERCSTDDYIWDLADQLLSLSLPDNWDFKQKQHDVPEFIDAFVESLENCAEQFDS